MKPTASYLQHNLNGEHCCEDNVSVGQDLRKQCKIGGLSSFFILFLIVIVKCAAEGLVPTWFL